MCLDGTSAHGYRPPKDGGAGAGPLLPHQQLLSKKPPSIGLVAVLLDCVRYDCAVDFAVVCVDCKDA